MTLPNFLIVGATRSGTTALHGFLRQHPDIFMSHQKELYFLASDAPPDFQGPGDDIVNRIWVKSWDEYRSIFAEAGNEKAIGEATPYYLCARESPRLIKRYLPDAKLIMVLRNPVGRAFSSYMFMRQYGWEQETNFSSALAKEQQRKQNDWQYIWRYRELGLYSGQVQRFLDMFQKEQIWIGIFDDFTEDPLSFVQDIFRFLDVDDGFEPSFGEKRNASGSSRFPALHRLLQRDNPIKTLAQQLIPRRYRAGIRDFVLNRNLKSMDIPSEAAEELKAFYRPDIEKLEHIIERDLSAWK